MRSQALGVFGLIVCTALAAERTTWAQERTVEVDKGGGDRGDALDVKGEAVVAESATAFAAQASIKVFPLEPGIVFHRVETGALNSDVIAGDPTVELVYSNTFGTFGTSTIPGLRWADDLATSSVPGAGLAYPACRLKRMEFPVLGRVDTSPGAVGGPYTVNFELFSSCPGSVTNLTPIRIPGSAGQAVFPDDGPRLISHTYASSLQIPNTVWLAVTFSRENAGMVAGSPAQQGFSCDKYDSSSAACNSNHGGFPTNPYAAFNVQLFGDVACNDAHVVYRANRPSGPIYNPGAFIVLTDDIELDSPGCQMVSYEVAVRGQGAYTFSLRNQCDSAPITGTQRIINASGNESRILRALFDPPVAIPRNFSFAASVSNATGAVITAGEQACVGRTEDFYQVPAEEGGCTDISPLAGIHSAMNLTITCAGAAPVGACCDMFFADENGESVCRQVPHMNCPFPPRDSGLRPEWVQGAECSPDPFIPQGCGRSACCKPDDSCDNLTVNECNAVPPLDRPRQWQSGLFCGDQSQECPLNACLGRHGQCTLPRTCPASCDSACNPYVPGCPAECFECPPFGCDDPSCCSIVCGLDFFCCDIEWDITCAGTANQLCDTPPSNDVCAPTTRLQGARLLAIPGTTETPASRATPEFDDPGFGCYVDEPGRQAEQTVWYKFIAPPAIAPATRSFVNLSTCASNAPADDSLLQVFAVGDPTDQNTQCHSLIPYACSDNFSGTGCTRVSTLSSLCLRDLIPGNLYYVLQAAKVAETSTSARYKVTTSQATTCTIQHPDTTNDFCPRAVAISDGVTPFNLARVPLPNMDPPIESCIPTMINDIWYDYTASCTGRLTVQTCGADALSSPDTNLAIYDGIRCPMINNPILTIECSADAGGACGFGSKLVIDAVQGHGYKIRLADSNGNRPSGNLTISCAQAVCPAGEIAMVAPPEGIPEGVVDARRPHSPSSATPLEGIQAIKVTLTRDALPSCFTLCETAVSGSPNLIDSVLQGPPPDPDLGLRIYTINLTRPITPGAKTTLIYTDSNGGISYAHVISHPGNVGGDGTTSGQDVLDLRDALEGAFALPWGLFSGDLNRSYTGDEFKSSGITPADMLEAADLVNGGGAYDAWINTPNPDPNPACP